MSPFWGQLAGVITVTRCWCSSASGRGRGFRITSAVRCAREAADGRRGRTRDERVLVRLDDLLHRPDDRAILFLFFWGLRVDIPTQPTARAATCGRTACCAKACASFRRGGSCSRRSGWSLPSAISCSIRGSARSPACSAGRRTTSSQGDRKRTARSQRRCACACSANRSRAIAGDADAMRAAAMLFVENCAACHGRDARGNAALGAPDLTDRDSLHGGDGKAILASITDGRRGAMPPFAGQHSRRVDRRHRPLRRQPLGHAARLVARADRQAALRRLRRLPRRRRQRQPGARRAEPHRCRLALRRSNRAGIAETIRRGRNGEMPAWSDRLGDEDASLVAAWVYSRSRPAIVAAR